MAESLSHRQRSECAGVHAGHVVVSLDDLLGDAHVTAVEEMALDGAQRLADVRRLRWRAGDSITHGGGDRPRETADAGAALVADYLSLGEVRDLALRWACSWRLWQRAVLMPHAKMPALTATRHAHLAGAEWAFVAASPAFASMVGRHQ